jgi:tRNA threonylcarbamoyladenosine biosynthesis protein TsaE
VSEHVASSTFTIVNEYHTPAFDIYHFDLYRVNSVAEIRDLGFEEYTSGSGICLIEWAEKAAPILPGRRYDVVLKFNAGSAPDPDIATAPDSGGRHNLREITIAEIAEVAA